MNITRGKEQKYIGSKIRQTPTRRKTKTTSLLIESNQSEISNSQDQDQAFHIDPKSTLLHAFSIVQSQQKWILVKLLKSGQLLKFQLLLFQPPEILDLQFLKKFRRIRAKISSSSLSFDSIGFPSYLGTKIDVHDEWIMFPKIIELLSIYIHIHEIE